MKFANYFRYSLNYISSGVITGSKTVLQKINGKVVVPYKQLNNKNNSPDLSECAFFLLQIIGKMMFGLYRTAQNAILMRYDQRVKTKVIYLVLHTSQIGFSNSNLYDHEILTTSKSATLNVQSFSI
jgi:hypothetical protein